jgi:hypothetical protein
MEEEGVPSTALREISLLQMLSESIYIVRLLKVEHVEENGKPILYLVRLHVVLLPQTTTPALTIPTQHPSIASVNLATVHARRSRCRNGENLLFCWPLHTPPSLRVVAFVRR